MTSTRALLASLLILALCSACEDSGSGESTDTTMTSDAVSDAGADAIEDTGVSCPGPNGIRPRALSEHAGVYDPVGERVVIFGGSQGVPVECDFPTPTFQTETYIYDLECGLWEEITEGAPRGRARHMAVYDSVAHRMLVFGGRYRESTSGNYTLLGDLWAFDLDTLTWSEITTNAGPSARVNGALIFDSKRNRLIVIGGNTASAAFPYEPQNDVWTLSLETGTWTELTPSGDLPEPRLFHAGFYDASRDWYVIYGGSDNSSFSGDVQYFADVWALDLTGAELAWRRLDQSATERPIGRFWAGMVHDAERDRYVLFGGHDNGQLGFGQLGNDNKLFEFDPDAGQWTELREGDTLEQPPEQGTVCEFPVNFTNVDPDSPERRNAHVFVAGADAAFTFGGKTDCGIADDLWQLDFATDTWSELVTATVGEVCLRRGGSMESCSDMCF